MGLGLGPGREVEFIRVLGGVRYVEDVGDEFCAGDGLLSASAETEGIIG